MSSEIDRSELTPVGDLKRPRAVTLPSGIVVMIHKVSMSALVKSGKVPNALVPMAYKYVEGKHREGIDEKNDVEKSEILREIDDTLDAMVQATVEWPKIVLKEEEEKGEDVLWVGRLSDYDKSFILQLAQASLATLEQFRPGRPDIDIGPDRPKVRGVTLRSLRNGERPYLRAV